MRVSGVFENGDSSAFFEYYPFLLKNEENLHCVTLTLCNFVL